MRSLLLFVLRGYLFWLLFFFLNRLIFAIYNFDMMDENGWIAIMPAFLYGLRLDLSLAAYLMALPTLIFAAGFLLSQHRSWIIIKIYFIVCIILVSLICTADLQLYREWGSKINAQVLTYLSNPDEVIASTASAPVGLLAGLLAAQIFAGLLFFKLIVRKTETNSESLPYRSRFLVPILALVLAGLSVILMRGGFQLSPMNQSFVYYSNSAGANQCAVNASWNFLYYFFNSGDDVDVEKYQLMDEVQADSIFNELYKTDSSDISLFEGKPNIVLLILESFTADGMEDLGGENLMPELSRLSKEGLLFDSIYASGDRTDKGLAAIISAFPAQPVASIITEPYKFPKLNYLPAELSKLGYHSSFLYGGESEFANMKAYLLQGFEKIIDRADFDEKQLNSKWGAHDEAIFAKSLEHCMDLSSPFFHCVLTLSSHEPFDAPGFKKYPGTDEASMFKNSILYSDSCIGDYMKKAAQQAWYENTIFVLVADHGHRLVKNYKNNFQPGKYRIPLLIYGKPLKEDLKGKRIHKIGSQTDIAATLLASFQQKNNFKYSRSLMSVSPGFAFYAYNDGFGWVRQGAAVGFDYVSKSVNFRYPKKPEALTDKILAEGKAYMQKMIDDYSSFHP